MTLAWRMPDIRQIITAAEAQVREPVSLEQREAGNYQKGHFTWCGLDITLESAKGMERKGVDRNGKAWSITLKNSYGYIKGTDSAEPGDEMDVFVGDDPEIELIYVVDQNKNDKPEFDEHKCIIGCANSADAKAVYLANYSAGWKGFRSVTALTVPQFKSWLENGDMTKPLKGQRYADFCKEAAQLMPNLPQHKKRKLKDKLYSAAPWLAGGAVGASLVSEALRRGAFTPEVLDAMRDFSKKQQQDAMFRPYANLSETEQALQGIADYAVQGNRLLQHRFWGLFTPTQLIKALRSGPSVADKDKWTPESLQHYQAFENGPLSGFLRVLGELSQGGWQTDDKSKPLPRLGDEVRQSFKTTLNSMAGRNLVDSIGGSAEGTWNFPAISNVSKVPLHEQLSLMRSLPGALKGTLSEDQWRVLGDNARVGKDIVYRGYGKLTDAMTLANDSWRNANLMAATAGALGLGAYGLHKWLKSKPKKQEEKQAGISKLLSAGLRRAAKVPAGQAFAPTVGTGVRRVLKLGFNPELGRTGNIVKRVLQGAGLYGGWRAADGLVSTIGETAGEAARFIPNGGKLEPTNRYLESWRDAPWATALRTAWKGIPSYVPDAQRELVKHLAVLAAKNKLHGGHMPSMTDVAKKFYSPAVPHTFYGVRSLLGSLVGPPTAEDYGKVLTDAADVYKQPPVQ